MGETKNFEIEFTELCDEYEVEVANFNEFYNKVVTLAIQVQARVSPMLADNEKRFLRLLIRDKKEEYGDELKTDIDLIRAVKQESIVKMDLLLEKLQ